MDRVPLSEAVDKTPEDIEKLTPLPNDGRVNDAPSDFMDDIEYHRMSDFFDLTYDERKDFKMAEKLSYLTDWALSQTKSKERIQHMEALNSLKRMLGITYKGAELVRHLYKWARLDERRRSIEKEMSFVTENAKSQRLPI